jgi:hypothetical protein
MLRKLFIEHRIGEYESLFRNFGAIYGGKVA